MLYIVNYFIISFYLLIAADKHHFSTKLLIYNLRAECKKPSTIGIIVYSLL